MFEKEITTTMFPKLEKKITIPVAIIGGGLCGTLLAYKLKEAGIDAIVLEANRIGSSKTGHTTAKITAGHHLLHQKIAATHGFEAAALYAKANLDAIQQYKSIIDTEQIDCDWKRENNYIYALTAEDVKAVQKELEILKKLNIPCNFTTKTSLPFTVQAAIQMPNQASFHPIKFLHGIAKHVAIYENSKVITVNTKLQNGYHILKTEEATISAKNVVFCTGFPFINTPGYYFLRMHQSRSYVMAIEMPSLDFQGMYIDANKNGLSFRPYENYLFIGGAGHRCGHYPKEGTYSSLEQSIRAYYPHAKIVDAWATQDCIPLDHIPYIGQFSHQTPNMFVATGFQKWGMTTSMVAATLLTDLIQNKKNMLASLYTPNRFHFSASIKEIGSNTIDALKGYTIDQITSFAPICPHLGCKLFWNPEEQSWDCPCHGSRFDKEGRILSNPAQKGISIL